MNLFMDLYKELMMHAFIHRYDVVPKGSCSTMQRKSDRSYIYEL